jgi:ATP-dependent Clp protease adapter protein ClpS
LFENHVKHKHISFYLVLQTITTITMTHFLRLFLFVMATLISSCSALLSSTSTTRVWGRPTASTSSCLYATSLGIPEAATPTIRVPYSTPFQHDDTRTEKRESTTQSKQDCYHEEFFELRLYNDQDNYEYYVAEQLVTVAGLTELQAFRAMRQADATGQSVIGEYYRYESAEYYQQALQTKGLVVDVIPLDFQ